MPTKDGLVTTLRIGCTKSTPQAYFLNLSVAKNGLLQVNWNGPVSLKLLSENLLGCVVSAFNDLMTGFKSAATYESDQDVLFCEEAFLEKELLSMR